MNIPCATDLQPKSESAVDRAGILAEKLGSELSLLHIVPPTESEELTEQDLQSATAQLEERAVPPCVTSALACAV